MTDTNRRKIAKPVCSRGAYAPAHYAPVAAWQHSPASGLALHSAKRTGMTGIDTDVWPMGLRGLSSG